MLPILHQSIWRDEAFSILVSEKSLNEIFLLVTKDVQAPLYYFILHYWMLLFGNSEAMIRSLSVVFHLALGILTLFFVYKLTKNLFASVFTSLVILFNPFLLFYAFEARPYSMLAFLVTLALYLVISKRFFLASIVLALSVLTHNFAMGSLVGLLLYWFLIRGKDILQKDKTVIRESFILFALPVVSMLLWGSFAVNQLRKITEAFWIGPITSGIFLQTFEKFFGGTIYYEGKDFLLTIVFILTGFVIASWIINEKTEKFKEATIFIFVSLTPIIISYLVSVLWVPNFHERYVIASLPLFIIFSAISLHKLATHGSKNLSYVLVSLAVLYLVSSIQVAERIVRTPTKPPINYAVDEILKRAQEGDIITPKDYINFTEIKYYVRRAGSDIPINAVSETGEIIWYANSFFIEPHEIVREIPRGKRVWQVNPDGGYEFINK